MTGSWFILAGRGPTSLGLTERIGHIVPIDGKKSDLLNTAILDALPAQRTGPPRETPPPMHRHAFVNLQIFPRYYEIAEEVRAFLGSNTV